MAVIPSPGCNLAFHNKSYYKRKEFGKFSKVIAPIFGPIYEKTTMVSHPLKVYPFHFHFYFSIHTLLYEYINFTSSQTMDESSLHVVLCFYSSLKKKY